MRAIGVVLALSRGTITRDYQGAQITIDLSFVTRGVTNRLIYCDINEDLENSFDHLLVRTMLNLKTQDELLRHSRRNWKAMDLKKFDNILKNMLPKPLLNNLVERGDINEYTTRLLDVLEKAIDDSTS